MGGKKGGGKFEVSEYRMSMHVGVCLEADALTAIYIGEKQAWAGLQDTQGTLSINAPELFGGKKKEGGVVGTVTYLPGDPDQVLPDNLAVRLGATSGAACPGFRGLTTLFFTGSSYGYTGFTWVSNNPYMKDLWVGVRRAPKGLNPDTAMIPRSGGLVPFTASAPVVLKWWQSTYPQGLSPNDKARMGLQYFNAAGDPIGDIQWAELIATSPPHTWVQRTLNSTIPSNTVAVRVYMEMVKVSGSYNDGYIDDITLTIGGNNFPLVNGDAEAKNDYGWTTEVGSVGTRITNPAPHGGTRYFTGSSAAITRAYQSFTESATGEDANPAHIIYECLTNQDWGMGSPASLIDVASFNSAAVTLLLEGLGLSMIWTRQTTIEAFVSEVLDHINAMIFINPRNGLLTLKLIRGDYNVDDLREITVDNAKLTNFQRKAWGEIINEVVVTWTNPENEQDETVVLHDNAAIASQGGIISDGRNYYGVRSADLAMKMAARDLRVSSTPLATCECEVNRTLWDIIPGEVVKVTWPDRGLNEVPMRVGPVDYGKPGQMEIKFSLMEDIFGYATTDYSSPPTSGWEGADDTPLPMEHSKVITVPSFFAANYLPQTSGVADIQYPEVIAGVLATSSNAISYDTYGNDVSVTGTVTQKTLSTNTVAGYATTIGALPVEATSNFVGFTGFKGQVSPENSVFVFIGGPAVGDTQSEVALITASNTNSFTLRRGVLDTVPRAWPAGTPCYFVKLDSTLSERVIRSDAENVSYKLLSRVVGGVLSPEAAPTLTGTLNGRPHLPLRPANVKVNSVAVGPVNVDGLTTVPITWSNRNRTMENSQVVYWDDATVTPETGQTTKITLLTTTGTVITSFSGLTGTSYSLATSAFGANSQGIIRVSSERDGFESLQYYDVQVYVQSGYGLNYGNNYGGGSGYTGEVPPSIADYPATNWWDTFNPISETAYTALTETKIIAVAAGGSIFGRATLDYSNPSERHCRLGAKWQYKLVDTATWIDFAPVVYGTDAYTEKLYLNDDYGDIGGGLFNNNSPTNYEEIPHNGAVTVNQTVTQLPIGNYEIRMVANASIGGTTLVSTGTATVGPE